MSEVIASTYELIKKLGSGGGGIVYLADHLRLNKKVVLKADKKKITTNPEILRREVDVLKNLSHSNIPQVYDFFASGGTVYTVMDYIEGESLDKPLERGERFSQPQVIRWGCQLLDALIYLHSPTHGSPPRGFVHSDIKPANLMRKPDNTICLIDFNIALALGEENAVGYSVGYSSPEHYGLDFTVDGDAERTATLEKDALTRTIGADKDALTVTMCSSPERSSSGKKTVVPDVRSDIYSVGATLYHLLSGKRPAKHAKEVVLLSEEEFSPQIVQIISKAMNPNPDLRYQTAEEMLYAFAHLHETDSRTKRWRKKRRIAGILFPVWLLLGVSVTFTGLKRMQVTEQWKKLAQYSQKALAEGDTKLALREALKAFPDRKNILMPAYIPEAQNSLTEALGVYDLADGFKKHKIVELPSNPLCMAIAPDGRSAACIYSGFAAVFDTETAEITATLPACSSALSEVQYLNEHTIIYAGAEGIEAYDLSTDTVLWTGKPCTALSISEDGHTAAAVYKEETFATIYNAENGEVKKQIDFKGKSQSVTVNDIFANPNDNLLELNRDGTLLGVSFADGSLEVFDLTDSGNDIELYDETSGYTHFEGGFCGQYLSFSATASSGSVFAVIDTVKKEQTGGFDSDGYFGTQADERGIYVQRENLLVKIHPVTGEQTPLVTMPEQISRYAVGDTHTLAVSQKKMMFFDSNATLITAFEEEDAGDFVQLAGGVALIGSADTPRIKIMKYEDHSGSDVFEYDPSCEHDEARISADKKTVMLFNYKQFEVYDISGKMVKKQELPNPDQVYDQQFVRENGRSHLDVTYNDGTVLSYNARDGDLISEDRIEKPDLSLYEEFETDLFRIESPLHGSPAVYDKKTDKKIGEWNEEGYLTYVTQIGNNIIAQYVTTDHKFYGVLLNDKCEVIARLPYLSDVVNGELYFDYPVGKMRKSRIYNMNELTKLARKELMGGK